MLFFLEKTFFFFSNCNEVGSQISKLFVIFFTSPSKYVKSTHKRVWGLDRFPRDRRCDPTAGKTVKFWLKNVPKKKKPLIQGLNNTDSPQNLQLFCFYIVWRVCKIPEANSTSSWRYECAKFEKFGPRIIRILGPIFSNFFEQKYLGKERELQDEQGSILKTTLRVNESTMGWKLGDMSVILLGHLKMV